MIFKPKLILALALYGSVLLYMMTRLITIRVRMRRQSAADRMRWENEGGLVAATPSDIDAP